MPPSLAIWPWRRHCDRLGLFNDLDLGCILRLASFERGIADLFERDLLGFPELGAGHFGKQRADGREACLMIGGVDYGFATLAEVLGIMRDGEGSPRSN
jgi:hypothetical protein